MSDSLRVLYIDDDHANLDSVSRALSRHGYTVFTASTGMKGLEVAEQHHPDIILLDILLPDMNGFDVCEQLRDTPRLKNIPVIALTASQIDKNRQASLSADFDGYLAKPPALNELVMMIAKLIR